VNIFLAADLPRGVAGCNETCMHERAVCQHRRDSTYAVPCVPADTVCAYGATTNTGVAMSRPMATWRCRVRALPRLRRASRARHRQPCGFHRSAGHESRLRDTRIFTNEIFRMKLITMAALLADGKRFAPMARPLIRRGDESPDGDLALPRPRLATASPGAASATPPTLRVSSPRRTRTRHPSSDCWRSSLRSGDISPLTNFHE